MYRVCARRSNYVSGVRQTQFLQAVQLNQANLYHLKLTSTGNYEFRINSVLLATLPRGCTTLGGLRYYLGFYFGGDETAPHDISAIFEDPVTATPTPTASPTSTSTPCIPHQHIHTDIHFYRHAVPHQHIHTDIHFYGYAILYCHTDRRINISRVFANCHPLTAIPDTGRNCAFP